MFNSRKILRSKKEKQTVAHLGGCPLTTRPHQPSPPAPQPTCFGWSPGKGVSTNQLEAPRVQQLMAEDQLPPWAGNPQLCDLGQFPQPRATDLFGTTLHLAPAVSRGYHPKSLETPISRNL